MLETYHLQTLNCIHIFGKLFELEYVKERSNTMAINTSICIKTGSNTIKIEDEKNN